MINSPTTTPVKSFGKVSCASGIFKCTYEGRNPVNGLAKTALINFGQQLLIVAIPVVIPPLAKWCLTKIGIREVKPIPSTSHPQPQLEKVETLCLTKTSFKDSVVQSQQDGSSNKILCESLHEGDMLILFGQTGIGKSIVAVQMAIGIASGKPCGLFPDDISTHPQNVLLIDTEQDATDLSIRYSKGVEFIPENITRISNCQFSKAQDVLTIIDRETSYWSGNGTVILDNITGAFSLQNSTTIREFYNALRCIQNRLKQRSVSLTVIIICHEVKDAKDGSTKSLQGSGNLSNFATTIYHLDKTDRDDEVLLRVVKSRRLKKQDKVFLEKKCSEPYLHFKYQGTEEEEKVGQKISRRPPVQPSKTGIAPQKGKLTREQKAEIVQLHKKGESINALSKRYNVSRGTIRKSLGAEDRYTSN